MRRSSSPNTGQMSLDFGTFALSPEVPVRAGSNIATSSSAVRHARTSASRDEVPACPQGHVPACGGNTSELSALSGHRSSLLRTLLALADGGSLRSRRRWPRSGTGGHTFASELATSGFTTNVTASLSLLPTLTATDGASGAVTPAKRPTNRQGSDNLRDKFDGLLCPRWCEQFMGFPAGWTECDVSAIASFQNRRRRRGGSSPPSWGW